MEIKEGTLVSFIAVTGEKGTGTYSCRSELTYNYLVERVTTLDGRTADYLWCVAIQELN